MRRFRKGGINVKYCGAVFYNAKLGIIISICWTKHESIMNQSWTNPVIVLMCPGKKRLKGEKRGYSSNNGYRD